MVSLSKSAAKQASYLAAKWAVKYGSRVYGSAFTYKMNTQMAVIPNKIFGKIVPEVAKMGAIGFLSFIDVFAMFPGMFDETNRALERWKKILNETTLYRDKEKLARQMAKEIEQIGNKWEHKMGMQSWLCLLNMVIPIPFNF